MSRLLAIVADNWVWSRSLESRILVPVTRLLVIIIIIVSPILVRATIIIIIIIVSPISIIIVVTRLSDRLINLIFQFFQLFGKCLDSIKNRAIGVRTIISKISIIPKIRNITIIIGIYVGE